MFTSIVNVKISQNPIKSVQSSHHSSSFHIIPSQSHGLILARDAAQDLHGLLIGGLRHGDGLEATLQRVGNWGTGPGHGEITGGVTQDLWEIDVFYGDIWWKSYVVLY